jgi:zinc protease
MNSINKYLVCLTVLIVAAACSSSPKKVAEPGSTETKSSDSSKVGFKLRDYRIEEWPNGLQVIVIENHTLPSVSYGLLVKDGSATDPMAKSGLTRLMAAVMTRGTNKMNALQIADTLGQLGTDIDSDTSSDYVWFQLSGLSQHQDKLMTVFSDVILHPRFDAKEIEREKSITLSAIKQRPDHPDEFVDEIFDSYLYGGHPYARPVSGLEPDVKSISKKDLVKAYGRFIRPNNSVLVVTGDVTPDTMNQLKTVFNSWVKHDLPSTTFPQPPVINGVNVRLVDKPDLTQSHIIIGNFGIKRADPDYLPLRIANIILGGNFSSRLMEQVRIKLGLTYGISSSFEAQLDRGPFEISTFTKNQSVGTTIEESLKVLRKFRDDGVESSEVDSAKNFLMGAFPRAIETPERLGFNLALLRLYGISDDYLKNFVNNVNSITAGDVNRAIKQHLNASDLKIVVLSNGDQSLEQVRKLGLLEVKKYNEVF